MTPGGVFIKHKLDLSLPEQNLPWLPSTLRKKFKFLTTSRKALGDLGSLAGPPVQLHLLPCVKLCLSHRGLFLQQMLFLGLCTFCSFCLKDFPSRTPLLPMLLFSWRTPPYALGLSSDASSPRKPSLNPRLGQKSSMGSGSPWAPHPSPAHSGWVSSGDGSVCPTRL